MILDDLKVGWRVLSGHRSYSAVVVMGLSLAIAAVVLMYAYLGSVLYADNDVPDAGQVVRLEQQTHTPGAESSWITGSPMVFFDNWKNAGAPIFAGTRYYTRDMSIKVGSQLFLEKISFVDPSIATVFGLVPLEGNLPETLARPDAIALSRASAIRLFGSSAAINKTLELGGKTFTVGAIVPDRVARSAISTAAMVNIMSPVMPEPFRLKFWFSIRGENYVRLLPGATAQQFSQRAQDFFDKTPAVLELPPAYGKIASFRATRLLDLPLYGAGSETTRSMVAALVASCVIITLLACINYINLSSVRIIARQREIGVRKALGANPRRIVTQFMVESTLVVALAAVLGSGLAAVLAPVASDWLGTDITATLFSVKTLLVLFLAVLVIGVAAGAYPSWIALGVNSAQSLTGRAGSESSSGRWLRRILTVCQFAAAMVLVSTAIVVLWQSNFAGRSNPGYDPAPIIAIDSPVDMRDKRMLAFRDAVSRLTGVQSVGLAWDIPGRFRRNTSTSMTDAKGQTILLALFETGPGFFQSFSVAPLAGRLFDPERDKQGQGGIVVINKRAAQQLGFSAPQDAVGQKLRMDDDPVEIVGVVPDIRIRSARDAGGGVVYNIGETNGISVFSVRSAAPQKTMEEIRALWPSYFPDDLLQMEPVVPQLERLFDGERRLGKLVGVGSLTAILLAGFGLYALAAYNVRRRRSEIVLRKLYGATRSDIALLLAKEVAATVLLSAAIGLPIAVWLAERYLTTYADRAPIGAWPFLAAFVCACVIALVAAFRHVRSAMAVSPASALRAGG